MVLFKCSLPEDGSFDETMNSLTESNSNQGYLCSDKEEHAFVLEYCHQQPLLAFAKGDKVRVKANLR